MTTMPTNKYRPYPTLSFEERTWPSRQLTKAPTWCSVDLRDGNQALINPMGIEEKLKLYNLLVAVGFKEIEVGFPSASQTEYDFQRLLIEEDRIPDDVTVQVLTQAREHLIQKSYESLVGVKKAIVHVYNSTSTAQRRLVFRKNQKEILQLAVEGASLVQQGAKDYPDTNFMFEYSPESFTSTELEYALEVCEAVLDVWHPTKERKAIINLPATVEYSTPNVYADQIEWFCAHLSRREAVILSVHTHNDRGTGVAASELALLAGADRVEGTLFGNGERTGNCDLTTMALNLFAHGVDPELDLSDINHVAAVYEQCTEMPLHPRHPYVGELVYTAFSGSHQDAIAKGMKAQKEDEQWEVPYLPIDPQDVGRTYESIIRINSQSGKGGAAYILDREYGLALPRKMQPEFGRLIQEVTDQEGVELTPSRVWEVFSSEYLERRAPYALTAIARLTTEGMEEKEKTQIDCTLNDSINLKGAGTGPLAAFTTGFEAITGQSLKILSFQQHALGQGRDASAVAYVQLQVQEHPPLYGVGIDNDINVAAIKALLSAWNRYSLI